MDVSEVKHRSSPPPLGTSRRTIEFGGLAIQFDEQVLTPREWTVAQSRWGEKLLREVPEGDVLEVCAGAGQIGLLATRSSARRLVGIERSGVAAEYLRINAQGAGMAERVTVREADLREALAPDEYFPLILADPPWVSRDGTDRFPEDPLGAIDGGADGLVVARACVELMEAHLGPRGKALLQLGDHAQALRLAAWVRGRGKLQVNEIRDFAPRGVLLCLDHCS